MSISSFLRIRTSILYISCFCRKLPEEFLATKYFVIFIIIAFIVALMIHGHQTESTYRLDFLWKLQATDEKEEMEHLQAYNKKLLSNILPVHVAEHFLSCDKNNDVCHLLSTQSILIIIDSIALLSFRICTMNNAPVSASSLLPFPILVNSMLNLRPIMKV